MDSTPSGKPNYWMASTFLLIGLVMGFGAGKLPFLDGAKFGTALVQKNDVAARPGSEKTAPEEKAVARQKPVEFTVAPVTEKDHIRGPTTAKVTIIEFSDTECPFCKRFHPTMQKVTETYPQDVRWVYRHFPLDALHRKARKEAEATECANELGGNQAFWAYLDRLFEVTPSNDGLDPEELPRIAEFVGLDVAKFKTCLENGKHGQRVADDLADAMRAGGDGTPYSVVIAPNGKKFPLSGSQPFESVKTLVDLALQEK